MIIRRAILVLRFLFTLILLSFFFYPESAYPQQTKTISTVAELVDISEIIYGPDDLLVNGKLYIPTHPRAEGNPYFQEDNWDSGSIIIKGKTFTNFLFIYNVEIDRVIIESRDINENKIAVLLNQDFVDGFMIGDHEFINLKQLKTSNTLKGYAELIYRSGLTMVIAHKKTLLKQYSQSNPFGSYSGLVSEKFIQEGDQLVKLPTKGSFLDYYSPFRAQLKKYFRTKNLRYKKATKNELAKLMEFCDGLVENN